MILAANVTRNVGLLIFVVLTLAWILYWIINNRKARPEVGSEIELAPNRKPYFTDEEMEGPRLLRTQMVAVGALVIVAVALPLYWLHEPSRQAGAVADYNAKFANWGSKDFAPTASGGFNCAGCHGGMNATGGVAAYTVTDPHTGEVQAVNWKAPALNTVLYRFSTDEVTFILQYGRPYSPMSAWGSLGGGPMTDQQISDIIEYLKSIQIPMEGCPAGERICDTGHLPTSVTDDIQKSAQAAVDSGQYKTLGEALFNLDINSGAYSCARCHTKGWSYDQPEQSGGGAMGPNLTGGSESRQFPNESDQVSFVGAGSELGKKYGQQGQGSGRMPGYEQLLTDDQIRAIVEYERSL
jgi:mono/diheme cytochrome c family protein